MRNKLISAINRLIRSTGLCVLPADIVVQLCQDTARLRVGFQEMVAMQQLELRNKINALREDSDEKPEFYIN